jgi:ABC-type branched-subunit amino acid transport system ATPase component
MSAALETAPAPLLRVEGLRRAFGGLVAVDGLSFTVRPGEIVGLLGPNGSGKTTALNLISGALAADAGRVVLEGREVAGLPAHRLARLGIARTFQLVRVLPGLSLAENVEAGLAFGREPVWGGAARARAVALLGRVGLGGREGQSASVLTYGDQKRLELARALALSPRLLLLDEWLAGLNPTELQGGIDLIASLRDEGCTVLMVEHVMDAIRALADRCVVMNAGRPIAEGPPAEVLADRAVIAAYLGDEDA